MVGKFPKKSFRDVPLDGRAVLVRVDYNVPLHEGVIDDDFRIRASLPTIEALLKRRCKVVLCAHLGRPEGKPNETESLEPVAHRLMELLHRPVKFVSDCVGDKVVQASKRLHAGDVLLLENLRFHPGEEANDREFAAALARDSSADYFVQDGFGIVHRAHASTEAVTHFLPSSAGLLLEKEYHMIMGAMNHPKRPLTAILGGAKISDKIPVIEKFVAVADQIIIGGAMANTFLRYNGLPIGKSKVEDGCDDTIRHIYDAVAKKATTPEAFARFLMLPTDVAVATTIDEAAKRRVVGVHDVAASDIILDIGTDSIERTVAAINQSHTVVWNGTMGMAELPNFAHGSARVALALAQQKGDVTSIVGGGDTADFVMHWDGHDGASFDHVSTGGGASIELMSGAKLPGIEALMDA
ncbi:MAG: phosphoglycerate kinase [Candidatus Saccharimonadales bacterium]